MRLGILIFDNTDGDKQAEYAADALTTALRARDIDVVINAPEPDALTTPERPAVSPADEEKTPVVLTTFGAAQEAGARLGRADCDGVLFWLGAGANSAFAPPAALTLACPILLCGSPDNSALYETAGILADRGIAFDRLFLPSGNETDTAARVEGWLAKNSKKERQKGTEAAQKLFGTRLILGGGPHTVDAAQWFHQFGVLVIGADAGGEVGENDLVVQSGDGCAELTFFLLRCVCDDDQKNKVSALRSEGGAAGEAPEEPATFVQIFRRKGRFMCLLTFAPPAAVTQSEAFNQARIGSTIHSAPGDVRSRIKAACSVLNIDMME